jgi:restriction system protein
MKQTGPEFIRFMKPILRVLKDLGGSGTAGEVADRAIELLKIPEQEQQIILKSGQSRVYNQVHWARHYLARSGYIDSSKRGVWSLTEKGAQIDLNAFDQHEAFKIARKLYAEEKEHTKAEPFIDASDESPEPQGDYKSELLSLIQSLPPDGFERLCQRLLRESGFQNVIVTGRSNDGGIDGTGILQINPFVSFVVLFQCKKYQGSVSPSHIRDFRGAMMGRADKGIILTTGTFTTEAKKEARRDGAPPIELVSGEDLIKLFENLELGLMPRRTFEVDHRFFDEFSKKV